MPNTHPDENHLDGQSSMTVQRTTGPLNIPGEMLHTFKDNIEVLKCWTHGHESALDQQFMLSILMSMLQITEYLYEFLTREGDY